jgi:HSP20 family protein
MNLTSLVPFRGRTNLARTDVDMFGSLQREIDRLFDDFLRGAALPAAGAGLVPSIDVTESDNEIEVTVELPGLERNDVDISVDDDVLIIRGEKKIERERGDGSQGSQEGRQGQGQQTPGRKGQGQQAQGQQAQGQQAQEQQGQQQQGNGTKSRRVTERMYGAFYRAIQLPPGVDLAKIEATMSNGVLKIRIPKPAQSQPKKIEVKEAA